MILEPGAYVSRYRVIARIGGGGMGDVYRAHDEELDRDVAIKVIAPTFATDPEAVRRFAREAQSASTLNHPNIVSVFDAGTCEAGPFLVMELVAGQTLRSMIAGVAGTEAVTNIGGQIVRALSAAHAAGIVHRDIKPENVMVRSDGYVKVLDFGLARITRAAVDELAKTTALASPAESNLRTGDRIVGTAAYMSPEQARGDAVGVASDIFALGLVFYELATGRHPFAGEGPLGIVARILTDLPVPASHVNRDLPRDLDSLILNMLAKSPRSRPDAAEIERTLAALGAAPAAPASAAIAARRPRSHTVGRDDVRQELDRAFDAAVQGSGSIVALAGEPGIGKTTVCEEFLEDIEASGLARLVARGRCSERQAGASAYLPWLELLDSMLGRNTMLGAGLLKATAPTWYAQVAPLATGDSEEGRALTVNRGGSQQWMKRELAAFLEEAARQTPIVLLFDDVHWADASTVELLEYVGPRLGTMSVLVLVTYRPSDLALARHPFVPVKLDLESRGILRDVRLAFLTEPDVDRYLALEFPGHRFPPSLAEIVHEKTDGNPLFMVDTLRSLRDRGVIARHDEGWHLAQPITEFERDMPKSIRSMIELKISQLDDGDRRMLVGAAVQGVEFDSAIVARAVDVDPADVEDRLEALARLHALVQPVREIELPDRALSARYRFVHMLYQDALYGSLGPSRRAKLSAAVADALLASYGDQAATRATELAYLYEAARDFSHAAEFFLMASERARQVFADREALALAERGLKAVRALPESPDRAVRELDHLLSVAFPTQSVFGYAAPQLEETYEHAQALSETLGEGPQQFGVVTTIGAFRFMRAELGQALESANLAGRFADRVGDATIRIWSAWGLGAVKGHLGEGLSDAFATLEEGARLYDPAMHPAFMLRTGFDAGIGCRFQSARLAWLLGDTDGAIARADEAVVWARRLQHPFMIGFALFFRAWIGHLERDPDSTLEPAREALAVGEQYGYPHVIGWSSVLTGWATARTGDAPGGELMARSGLALIESIGLRLMRPTFLSALAEIEALQGGAEAALATLRSAEEVANRTEERCNLADILRMQGELLAAGGDRDGAERVLVEAVALAERQQANGFGRRAAATLRDLRS